MDWSRFSSEKLPLQEKLDDLKVFITKEYNVDQQTVEGGYIETYPNGKTCYTLIDDKNVIESKFCDDGKIYASTNFNKSIVWDWPLAQQQFISKLTADTKSEIVATRIEGGNPKRYEPKDLHSININFFPVANKKYVYRDTEYLMPTFTGKELEDQKCRDYLKKYFKLALQSITKEIPHVTSNEKNAFRTIIEKCELKGHYNKFVPFEKEKDFSDVQIDKKLDPFKPFNPRLNYNEIKKLLGSFSGGWRLEESANPLKSLIRESLTEVAIKKQNVVAERQIINTRFNLLFESTPPLLSKYQKNILCDRIISEMIYLNNQNYNSKLISESFFDMIGGVFGDKSEKVLEYFKNHISNWFSEKLTTKTDNSWISSRIKEVVNSTPNSDIPKLVDCSYITNKLSEKITNDTINNIDNVKHREGEIHQILKDVISDSIKTGNIQQKIQSRIGEKICPELQLVKTNLENKVKETQQKVISK